MTRAPRAAPGARSGRALLVELLAAVRALQATLDARRAAAACDDDRAARLLGAIAAAVGDRAFSSRELARHTAVDGALQQALVETFGTATNARKLGKRLQRIEGRALDGVILMRIGADRDGLIWRCWRV